MTRTWGHLSLWGSNLRIISKKNKKNIFVDICSILAHIIIEVSKSGYFIFSSFIYWHGLIQTQIDYLNLWLQVDLNVKTLLDYCYFLFTGIKYCVAVKEMYNSNPVWTSLLLFASIVQGLNNQCERIEETHRNVLIYFTRTHIDDAPTNAQTLKHSCIFSHKTCRNMSFNPFLVL